MNRCLLKPVKRKVHWLRFHHHLWKSHPWNPSRGTPRGQGSAISLSTKTWSRKQRGRQRHTLFRHTVHQTSPPGCTCCWGGGGRGRLPSFGRGTYLCSHPPGCTLIIICEGCVFLRGGFGQLGSYYPRENRSAFGYHPPGRCWCRRPRGWRLLPAQVRTPPNATSSMFLRTHCH